MPSPCFQRAFVLCLVLFSLGQSWCRAAERGGSRTGGAGSSASRNTESLLERAHRIAPLRQIVRPKSRHPLLPLLELAVDRFEQIDRDLQDYSCVIVKRERVDGQLRGYEHVVAKIRHRQVESDRVVTPFSVYVRFLKPEAIKDREVLFVEGQNSDKLLVRRGGRRLASLTTSLDPRGRLAMQDSRYPVTDIGIKELVRKLVEVLHEELQYEEVAVKQFENAKINDRVCTRIQVIHPERRDYFRYHIAEIFLDDTSKLPVRFVSYDWPESREGGPLLLEEYTYLNIQPNVGLTDVDFDRQNPSYGFLPTGSSRGSERRARDEAVVTKSVNRRERPE